MLNPKSVLKSFTHQPTIFSSRPLRADLLRIPLPNVQSTATTRLRIHRNQPFEFIASLLPAFLAYSNRCVECLFSDYDDSLNFSFSDTADVELVWLDFERYSFATAEVGVDWLLTRLRALRERSRAPILVAGSPQQDEQGEAFNRLLRDRLGPLPAMQVLPLDAIAAQLGAGYVDYRFTVVGATRLSERANIVIARHLGLCWLPAVLGSRLKAAVFDLDNTLWGGVLGEDGIDGLRVDAGYRALHAQAISLADSGLFLGLLSRNEPEDVAAVLDLPYWRPLASKIAAQSIGWGSKAEGMQAIARQLRIGFDAILFVDDNPGELATVGAACPGIHLLHASTDPADTVRALQLYPGLFSWGEDQTDHLRANDLAMNDARTALRASAVSEHDYLASLQLEVRVAVNPAKHRARLQQLSEKTNQFNLVLRRLSEMDVADALTDARQALIGLWLRDCLSDSGLIGLLLTRFDGDRRLDVEELCISCRALGRGIEDALIIAAINAAIKAFAPRASAAIADVSFAYDQGPRNHPARTWLERFSGRPLDQRGTLLIPWNAEEHAASLQALPIHLEAGFPDVC